MYRLVTVNGTECIYGVLNDYDLAILVNADDSRVASSNQRTGTRPYLAMDFLDLESPPPHRHLPRHDLESLIYVIVVHTARYEDGKLMEDPPLQDWFNSDISILLQIKRGFSLSLPELSLDFHGSGFDIWITNMCSAIHAGMTIKKQYHKAVLPLGPDFDEETLNGHVTYEALEKIMCQPIEQVVNPDVSS
jgi:hypothetical protein